MEPIGLTKTWNMREALTGFLLTGKLYENYCNISINYIKKGVDIKIKLCYDLYLYFRTAGVAELADAQDLKSWGPTARGGSIPPSGTFHHLNPGRVNLFTLYFYLLPLPLFTHLFS